MTENIIGISGVAMVVATYLLLQLDKIDPKGFWYSFFNALGSLMILYSLLYHWNLSSFVIEIFWAAISFYGLWNWFNGRQQS